MNYSCYGDECYDSCYDDYNGIQALIGGSFDDSELIALQHRIMTMLPEKQKEILLYTVELQWLEH